MIDISSMVGVFQDDNAGRQAINDSHYQGYTLKFAKQSALDDAFASLYNFPKYGVGFYFGDFRNPNIGYPLAVFGWAEFPLTSIREKQKFSFGYGGEWGMAWNFRPYNAENNPTHVFLGSRANYIVGVYICGDYHINRNFLVGAAGGFRHFSNGGWAQPNIGINMLTMSVSAKYQINSFPQNYKTATPLPTYEPRWKWDVRIAAGRKQNGLETPHFYKELLGVTLKRQVSYMHSIGGGLETTFLFGRKDDGTARTMLRDIVSPALVGCLERFLSRKLVMPLEVGVYLFPKNIESGEKFRTYARIGAKYYLTPHFWTGITVKGHTNITHIIADCSEIGVGYTF